MAWHSGLRDRAQTVGLAQGRCGGCKGDRAGECEGNGSGVGEGQEKGGA